MLTERETAIEYAANAGMLRGVLSLIIARAANVGFDNPDLMGRALSDISAMAQDGLERSAHI